MQYPNNQTLKDERERRLGLVCVWVCDFPREGRSERDLHAHIRREFSCCDMTAYNYRKEARVRLGGAMPDLADLAGLLLEWGMANHDRIERSALTPREKVRQTTALIATLARLCPRRLITTLEGATPLFDPSEQAAYLTRPLPAGSETNGDAETCRP